MRKNFKEAGNTAVFTTKYVVKDKKDITAVYHYETDGAWEFHSSDEYDKINEVIMVVALEQILNIDDTIYELADLPSGNCATRDFKGAEWKIEKFEEE